MFRLKRPIHAKMHHPVYRLIYAGLYRIDRAIAPRVRIEDSLIISGFWRSGTTWIQNSLAELIDAKMVFEPFHPHNPEMGPVYAHAGMSFTSTHTNMFMPFVSSGAPEDHPVFALTALALRSVLRHRWTRVYRTRLADAFRPRVAVKFTRAALCLPAIRQQFGNPVLHIRRDPRAVIASAVYKTNRMGGKFTTRFDLNHFLLGIPDGRSAIFHAYRSEIARLQAQDLPVRLAGYWALSERALEDEFAAISKSRTCFICYEALAQDPERHAVEILGKLGYPNPDARRLEILHKNSLTTTKHDQSRTEQIAGWKKILPQSEADEIAAIARDFGFADALAD